MTFFCGEIYVGRNQRSLIDKAIVVDENTVTGTTFCSRNGYKIDCKNQIFILY